MAATGIAVVACFLLAATAAPSQAATTQLRAAGATGVACHARVLPAGRGVVVRYREASRTGLLRTRLRASGDWDLAVFDASSRRLVAAAASPSGRELADGFVAAGQRLRMQACRRAGAGARAVLRTQEIALAPQRPQDGAGVRVVSVTVRDRAARSRLARLGLDAAERADARSVDVVLHDAADAAALDRAGLRWTVKLPDLRARATANAATDLRAALRRSRASRSAKMRTAASRRSTYRRLADYESELKTLARRHPGLVKLITLPHRSLQGRPVLGVEIARDVNVDAGQPVFLQLGMHHAREWPAAEHPMEWALELVDGYGRDPEITRLVDATRNIVVPVVNPDGFNLSREWPVDVGTLVAPVNLPAQLNGLLPIQDPAYTAALLGDQGISPAPGTGFSYKRRNCRITDGQRPAGGECESLLHRRRGVDLNRNYGGFWGGPGAGFEVEDDTYRGADPFSEPETQNVRELVSSRQVTTLITNHTYGDLILRPPGLAGPGAAPDEALLRTLASAMAAKNGYTSQHGYELYDTTGTTEDWSYFVTGGLGFTFEIGPDEFHPPYAQVAAHYARNRGAYLVALQSTADPARHAVLAGRASAGTVLRAHKEVASLTSPVLLDFAGTTAPARSYRDVLDTTMTVGSSGRFEWHLNPSTRPGAAAAEAWSVTCERPAGTVLARGEIVVGRGERKRLDICALGFSAAVDRRPLARALHRGLRARARCSLACSSSVDLSLDSAAARRLGLTRGSRRVVVARGDVRRSFGGRKQFSVRFTAAARRRLRGATRVRLRVTARARSGTTDRRVIRRTLTLTR
ncbi:MAG: M14 family zinc carboxypeptidase [Thermoleophilia bacterium]